MVLEFVATSKTMSTLQPRLFVLPRVETTSANASALGSERIRSTLGIQTSESRLSLTTVLLITHRSHRHLLQQRARCTVAAVNTSGTEMDRAYTVPLPRDDRVHSSLQACLLRADYTVIRESASTAAHLRRSRNASFSDIRRAYSMLFEAGSLYSMRLLRRRPILNHACSGVHAVAPHAFI